MSVETIQTEGQRGKGFLQNEENLCDYEIMSVRFIYVYLDCQRDTGGRNMYLRK